MESIQAANTFAFPHLLLADALTAMRQAGYRHVELSAVPEIVQHIGGAADWNADVELARCALAETGTDAVAVEVGLLRSDVIQDRLLMAHALGIDLVNIGPGGRPYSSASRRERVAALRDATAIADDLGIRLAMKAHAGSFMPDLRAALAVMDAIDNPVLGFDLDPSHYFRAGDDLVDVVRGLATRLYHVNIRDCPTSGGAGSIEEQTCGRGAIDLPGMMAALREVGYEGPISFELVGVSSDDTIEHVCALVAEAREYVGNFLATEQ